MVTEVMMANVEPPPWEGDVSFEKSLAFFFPFSFGRGATYTTHGPEQVWVLTLVNGQDLATRRHHLHLQDLVGGKAIAGT